MYVEDTCNTLVTQPPKRSGMRWRNTYGHAVLALRALLESSRFGQAWVLLSNTYRQDFIVTDRNGPRELDSAVSEIFLGFQAAKSR